MKESPAPFERVKTLGLAMSGVDAGIKYDGSPVLKRGGAFMAGVAAHRTAEPGTLVIRADLDDREAMIADAPGTYYLTDYHRRYPVVLVRLSAIDDDALRDVLFMSWRLTEPKSRRRRG
jgi:hypothetical protein